MTDCLHFNTDRTLPCELTVIDCLHFNTDRTLPCELTVVDCLHFNTDITLPCELTVADCLHFNTGTEHCPGSYQRVWPVGTAYSFEWRELRLFRMSCCSETERWMSANRMNLNQQKTEVFVCGPSFSLFVCGPSFSLFVCGPSFSLFVCGPSFSLFVCGPSFSRVLSYHWRELPQISFLSRQTRVYRDTTRLVFDATKYFCLDKPAHFVAYFCCDKRRVLSP